MSEGPAPLLAPTMPADESASERDSLALLVARVEHALRTRLNPALLAEGLTPEHWRILSVLLERPGLPMSALAEAAVLPSASLTRHVDRLVERALVVRRIDASDKRRAVTALSPMGRDLTLRLHATEREIEADVAAGLGAERHGALVRELRILPHLFD
jgi:DNA-binding MarR family transcriptional regulator